MPQRAIALFSGEIDVEWRNRVTLWIQSTVLILGVAEPCYALDSINRVDSLSLECWNVGMSLRTSWTRCGNLYLEKWRIGDSEKCNGQSGRSARKEILATKVELCEQKVNLILDAQNIFVVIRNAFSHRTGRIIFAGSKVCERST